MADKTGKTGQLPPAPPGASDDQVKEVLADPELAALLMDPQMQRVLQECGDPRGLQKHMSDPDTRRKLDKLFKSGLINIQR
jgi:hypothetical protein